MVIGISAYKDSRIPALRYAASDARAFYHWLVNPQGGRYAPANVKLLLDGEATVVNIRQALFDWLQQAVAEDQVTIFLPDTVPRTRLPIFFCSPATRITVGFPQPHFPCGMWRPR